MSEEPQGGRSTALADAFESVGREAALATTVAAIFTRVLRHAPVAVQDDFFELGGDSILSVALMAAIEEETGRELPVTAIYDAPTPAALAALLAEGAHVPRASCLVLFKSGTGTPLFILHGLGGSVMELRELAQRLDTDSAVYGLEARGLDGLAAPFDRVEDMASFHLEAIRRLQPSGPYRLAGYSFGGLVALEMAWRLTQAGETVEFLGLLDTYPHTKFWPLRCRIAAWSRLASCWLSSALWRRLGDHYARELRGLPLSEWPAYILKLVRQAEAIPFDMFHAANVLRRWSVRPGASMPGEAMLPPAIKRVQQAGEAAFDAYRPVAYAGEIVIVSAAGEAIFPIDAHVLWRALVRKVTVYCVPEDHLGLVRTGVAPLAAVVSAALRCAGDAPRSGRGCRAPDDPHLSL
jgi:acetoacetyl-CoA synthetase